MEHESVALGGTSMDKIVKDVEAAIAGIADGASILVSGFGDVGVPFELIDALIRAEVRDLTVIANNAGAGDRGLGALFKENRISRLVCSFPRSAESVWFERRYRAGEVELEVVPQGTLCERIRAGGAGIGGFFTPTAARTLLAGTREVRELSGVLQVFELPIRADVALVAAHAADRWGNLEYRGTARNFAPIMAPAAELTIAEVSKVVDLGSLSPEVVVTPGIYVDRVTVAVGAS
jgi:3-oxoadipate CoA-transferase, alpha subunit